MSRVGVTIDLVSTGNRIYWTIKHTTRDYTNRLVFSVTIITALLGNVFQQSTFLCSQAHVLVGWRPFHTKLLLFWLPSQDSSVMAAAPLYIASARTERKATLITVITLLRVTQPLHSNGCFSGSTILALSKCATVILKWVCGCEFSSAGWEQGGELILWTLWWTFWIHRRWKTFL
jgi:hypothetical protein